MKTARELVFQRLYAQRISHPTTDSPAQLVARLGAVQAQDYASAKWALGLRLVNGASKAIEQAVADQSIIRTWPMRGTLHLVAAEDIHWLLKLMAPATITGSARRYRELELDEPTLARTNQIIVQALQEHQQLTRGELLTHLQRHGISAEGQRAAYILQRAALERLICRSAADGSSAAYCLLTVPEGRQLTREEALAELARRYFSGHGPATLQDFVWWSGLRVTEACAGLEAVKSELLTETLDGQTYWWAEPTPPQSAPSPVVHLLPGFDEYYLGYRERSAIIDPQHADKIVPGGNGIFKPMIVVDGRVVGIWKRTIKKSTVLIEAMPFETLSPAEMDGFAAAAARYGEFLGLPVTLA